MARAHSEVGKRTLYVAEALPSGFTGPVLNQQVSKCALIMLSSAYSLLLH